jgi:hypothetical protein
VNKSKKPENPDPTLNPGFHQGSRNLLKRFGGGGGSINRGGVFDGPPVRAEFGGGGGSKPVFDLLP